MNRVQIVEMVIESAEQLPEEPLVNIKVIGPQGEPIEKENKNEKG